MQALPADKALDWRDKAEVKDLYSVYIGRMQDSEKQALLREALGISTSDAEALQDLVSAGQFHLEPSRKEEAFF